MTDGIREIEFEGLTETARIAKAPWIGYSGGLLIGGAGGIGSWTALYLARAFPNATITLIDMDHVELHNLGGQLFSHLSVGRSKVDAVREIISMFSSGTIYCSRNNIKTISYYSQEIVISAFDNMEARKHLFETCIQKEVCRYFIDGRLRASMFEVFFVDLSSEESIEAYRKSLFDDSEEDDGPCSFKQTSHVASMIGSYITAVATTAASNILSGTRRPIPFFSTFLASIFLFKKMTIHEYVEYRRPKEN